MGVGKVSDVSIVVCKVVIDGKKNIISVLLMLLNFILYKINGCFGVVKLVLCFLVLGCGVIVGGVVCIVFELVGV